MKKSYIISLVAVAVGGILIGLGMAQSNYFKDASLENKKPIEMATSANKQTPKLSETLLKIEPVEVREINEIININGKIALNGLSIHQISSRVPGRIDRIVMTEGASVKQGDTLAWVYSPEFISAQNEFLLAKRTVRALNNQVTSDLLEDAKATLAGAQNKLRILGANASDLQQLDLKGVAQEYMAIRAPISGKIIRRDVDPGGYLDTGSSLGSIANMRSLWFLGNVFEGDLPKLKEGQGVKISVVGFAAAERIDGRISFVSTTVDPQTHTVIVRVDLANSTGQLKPDMFAKAEVLIGRRKLPVVPRSAVVQDGAESFVIKQIAQGKNERVSVTSIAANDLDHLAITSGIQPGDSVVVEGGVLVDRALVNSKATEAFIAATKSQNPGAAK